MNPTPTTADQQVVVKFTAQGLQFLTAACGWTRRLDKAQVFADPQAAARRLWAGDALMSLADAAAEGAGRVARELAVDQRVLWKHFHHGRTRFIGCFGLGELRLVNTPERLVAAGILAPATIGRFDEGYRPTGALLRELEEANR